MAALALAVLHPVPLMNNVRVMDYRHLIVNKLKLFNQLCLLTLLITSSCNANAQIAPDQREVDNYNEFHQAVASGDLKQVNSWIDQGIDLEQRDRNQRTALLIATHFSHDNIVKVLLEAGADSNARDSQNYDLITIAAVNNDVAIIKLGLMYDADPTAITSPYQGTALIAAAHLGHVETVSTLIEAGAPLNHINNLGWTALIEAIVLGDGGPSHTNVLSQLVEAGADIRIGDRSGRSPLRLARLHGFSEMIEILEQALE